MLSLMTKGKVVVFVVISAFTIAFLAVNYVGLDRYVGGYRMTVDLPDAGGLFEGSEVTYRGVQVGRVESLSADADGARATLRITDGAPEMSADVEGRVVNRSAIGEQYLDLRGGSPEGEQLGEGSNLTLTAADLPPPIDGLLRSSRDMIESVPSDALNTVIDEGYEFTRGNGVYLARLLESSTAFARTADQNFLTTVSLIDSSGTVLATQEATASSFQSFSKDLNLLAQSLEEQDEDWRRVLRATPASARQLDRLFSTVGYPLGQLMSNMISTAEVFGVNSKDVKETLIQLPEGISITYAVMTGKGMRSGIQLSFFNPLPCVEGYEDTEMREGTDTKPGKPFNTKAGCTAPISSGINVRGPQAVLGDGPTVRSAEDLDDLMGGTP